MMQKMMMVVAIVGVTLGLIAETVADVSLVKAVQDQGLSVETSSKNLFDGIGWTDNEKSDARWYTSLKNKPCPQVTIPDAFHEGKRIVLKKYRVIRVSYWESSQGHNRSPIEWKIHGVRDDGTTVEIEHKVLEKSYWEDRPLSNGGAPESEDNTFVIGNQAVASEGFRSYKIEFLATYATTITTSTGSNDIMLNEFELVADICDSDNPQTIVSSEIEIDDMVQTRGEFSIMPNTGFYGTRTVQAPSFINKDLTTYRCTGYRLEKKNGDEWEEVRTVEGVHTFDYEPENVTDFYRVTWLWKESNYFVDMGPMTWVKYLRARGFNPSANVTGENIHASYPVPRLFDGTVWGGDGCRFVASISTGTEDDPTYVQLSAPDGSLNAGDEFFVSKYSLYRTYDANGRLPLAWKFLVMNQSSSSEFTEVVSVTNAEWPANSNGEGRNQLECSLDAPFSFTSLQFVPTDSAQAAFYNASGTTGIDLSLFELELYVNVANKKGSLRVLVSIQDAPVEGFGDYPHNTIIDESATLSAPEILSTPAGNYPILGYRLETFNEATCTWEGGDIVEGTTYAYTPDAEKRQRLTWVYDRFNAVVSVDVEPEDGEHNRVTIEPTSQNGLYAVGSRITITAEPINDGHISTNGYKCVFDHWAGDLDGLDIDVKNSTISFVVDKARDIVPVFKYSWLCYEYDKANEGSLGTEWRIKNNQWDLNVVKDDGAVTLAKHAWRSGSGSLDLSTPIYLQDDTQVYMTNIANEAMSKNSAKMTRITDLIIPHECITIGEHAFRENTTTSNDSSLTNLVIDCPSMTTIGYAAFTRCYVLQRCVLKVPALTTLGAWVFNSPPFTDTNFDDWDLSSLKQIPEAAFIYVLNNSQDLSRGTIRLPAVESIGKSAFGKLKQVSGYEFGTNEAKLKTIAEFAFESTCAKTFVFGSVADLDIDESAFKSARALETIRFICHAPANRVMLDRILTGNTATEMAKVYVSKVRDGWKSYVVAVDAIDDDTVKAQAEELGAWGAYKTSGEDGVWKAFVFAEKMPFDPKGTIVIVR